MSEANFERKFDQFNTQAEIDKITLSMRPEPDADGKMIPSFAKFIEKEIPDIAILTKGDIEWLREVYHQGIYSIPRPDNAPFDLLQQKKEEQIKREKEAVDNVDLTGAIELEGGTYFIPSRGEFYDSKNKYRSMEFFQNKLEAFLEFRRKYQV